MACRCLLCLNHVPDHSPFSSAYIMVQSLASVTTIVDLCKQRRVPLSFGSQHVAMIMASWGPIFVFGTLTHPDNACRFRELTCLLRRSCPVCKAQLDPLASNNLDLSLNIILTLLMYPIVGCIKREIYSRWHHRAYIGPQLKFREDEWNKNNAR